MPKVKVHQCPACKRHLRDKQQVASKRYVDKSGVTPVTDDYRHQYGLPDVTESDVPSFLLDETKG